MTRRLFFCSLLSILIALPAAAQSRDALPVPDIPGYKTLKCDFHMHTVFSDGEVWPTTRLAEAWRDGLDAISITDHAWYYPHEKDVTPDIGRPYAIAKPLADRMGIILVPGVEVHEGDQHFNVLFVSDHNAYKGLPLREALRKARGENAFAFWNHPGWKQKAIWFPLVASVYDEKLIQGMEIVNGPTFYSEALPWVEQRSLTIMANSDVHAPIGMDYSRPRTRPVTLVFAATADLAGIKEALFVRRTAAWLGEEVWGSEEILRGLVRGAITPEPSQLQFGPGVRQAGLKVHNRSAIPLRFRVLKRPEWARLSTPEIRAESITGVVLSVTADAPAGRQTAEFQIEITNLHTPDGQSLVVPASLSLDIQK